MCGIAASMAVTSSAMPWFTWVGGGVGRRGLGDGLQLGGQPGRTHPFGGGQRAVRSAGRVLATWWSLAAMLSVGCLPGCRKRQGRQRGDSDATAAPAMLYVTWS
jgi:hypothetical protein